MKLFKVFIRDDPFFMGGFELLEEHVI